MSTSHERTVTVALTEREAVMTCILLEDGAQALPKSAETIHALVRRIDDAMTRAMARRIFNEER